MRNIRMHKYCQAYRLAVLHFLISVTAVGAYEFELSQPDLDWLAYSNASGPGNRAFGPTWIGGLELNGAEDAFLPKSKEEPSRLGMALVAFDTSSDVVAGLSPDKYQVHSASLTMTMASATFPGQSLHYDDTPDSQAEILADIIDENFDSQRPFEMYGVGFRDGYTGFQFASQPDDPNLLKESQHLYASSDGGYLAYPIASDGAGQPLDVSNSITGGFSETAAGNSIAPFDPVPWAIGKTDLTVGAAIPEDTTFTFEVDLQTPGVLEYLQHSLAEGGVGFFVSSLTLTTQPGLGVFPYPQWYLKESIGGAVNGIAPTFTLDVTVPGDFDQDGDVDDSDLVVWQQHFGVDAGASADGDGDSDGADFLLWQRNYRPADSTAAEVSAVPEPTSVALLAGVLVSAWMYSRVDSQSINGEDRK